MKFLAVPKLLTMTLAFSAASKGLAQPFTPNNIDGSQALEQLPLTYNNEPSAPQAVAPAATTANMFWREHLDKNKRNLLNSMLDYNCGIDINQAGRNGHSALFAATLGLAHKDNGIGAEHQWIKKLIAHGADVNQRFPYKNSRGFIASRSSFEVAIINGDYEVFNIMLPHAIVNLEALHLAIKGKHPRIVSSLITHGAPIDHPETRDLLNFADLATNDSFDFAAHVQLFMMCQADSNPANNLTPKLKV